MDGISRRLFLSCGIIGGMPLISAQKPKSENVYRFTTSQWMIRLSVEFYDRYSSGDFRFNERRSNHTFCLSAKGEADHNCLENFSGSLAIARYHIQPLSGSSSVIALREHVRAIDQDNRINSRPPFERTIELQQGVASDIQAFGYQIDPLSSPDEQSADPNVPWCLYRQDLYLTEHTAPFLVIHWKHTLNAIRILDIIPAGQTRVV